MPTAVVAVRWRTAEEVLALAQVQLAKETAALKAIAAAKPTAAGWTNCCGQHGCDS